MLCRRKISLRDIQLWLGHSTYQTTADIYTHLDYRDKMNTANATADMVLNIMHKSTWTFTKRSVYASARSTFWCWFVGKLLANEKFFPTRMGQKFSEKLQKTIKKQKIPALSNESAGILGAASRNRTGTGLTPGDFKSPDSVHLLRMTFPVTFWFTNCRRLHTYICKINKNTELLTTVSEKVQLQFSAISSVLLEIC